MKFIVTGGHHNSALVVAKILLEKGHVVTWIGHSQAQYGDLNPSAEYLEVTASGLPFHDLKAGRLSRLNPLYNLTRLPLGFLQAFRILSLEKPDGVISFGSYIGATVALASWIKRIPLYLHEQTVAPGRANLLTSQFARKIFLTWPSSLKYYPSSKTQVIGLPLRRAVLSARKRKLFKNSKRTILVLGGKQGSHFINTAIFARLSTLLKSYNIIHQTGTSSVTGDYAKAMALKNSLTPSLLVSYDPRGYVVEEEIGTYLASADLVISRAGAHISYELLLRKVPCILIPFEHTPHREQLQNARMLARSGQALVLREKDLKNRDLVSAIRKKLLTKKPVPKPSLPENAGEVMVRQILSDLGK